jgi:sialate O-acetylesterase
MNTPLGRRYVCIAVICLLSSAMAQGAELSTAPLFCDHMVLQRSSHVPVWGTGNPGEKVTVRGSWGEAASAVVAADSTWRADLKTPRAGGPFQLTIAGEGRTLTYADVMAGEVWLCSGQSNMEMPLRGWPPADTVLASQEVIASANLPGLRVFTVARAFSGAAERRCAGSWKACSPETAPSVSATAFFFGRKLHDELHVPVGLVVSSWGGTVVDAWASAGFLASLPGYDSTLRDVAKAAESLRRFTEWNARYPQFSVAELPETGRYAGLRFDDSACSGRGTGDDGWQQVALPGAWAQGALGDFQGAVWFRKTVAIPRGWVGRDLSLALGQIDEMDITFVNGVQVGAHETVSAWNLDRLYRIPAALVDTTELQVAIRVINTYGRGGFCSPAGSMWISPAGGADRLDIGGLWRCMPVAAFLNEVFVVYGPRADAFTNRPPLKITYGPNMPSGLYNGMIAPLVPYRIAGAIWYQGEADVNRPEKYTGLLTKLIQNWRSDFENPGMPFYFTQIAPFDYGNRDESAYLREAQLKTLPVPRTGMAVTLDIGNARNIHPANKQDVGERLARWALARTYGRKGAYSGPLYAGFTVRGSAVEVRFEHAGTGLVLTGGSRGSNFSIAGADRVFHPARVSVKGTVVLVSNPAVPAPVAVRYAWSDTPDATLFNADGLPASSFRTDDWPR